MPYKNKEDARKHKKKYYQTQDGIFNSLWAKMIMHSKTRNHPPPSFTKEELREFIFVKNKTKFNKIWQNYVKCGSQSDDKFSINRLDNDKPYIFNNIELTTWGDNRNKSYTCPKIKKRQVLSGKQGCKQVLQFSLDGKFIQKYSSITEAEKQTNTELSQISAVCKGKRKTTNGFIWRYFQDVNYTKPLNMKNLILDKRPKSVIQFSLDGEFIKEYSSLAEAERQTKIDDSSISGVCLGNCNTAGGFIWRFFKDVGHVDKINVAHLKAHRYITPILQFSLDGKFIKNYPSISEAGRQSNICSSSISSACRGNYKTAGKFKWKYKRDYKNENK